ncbi:MAG: amidoligase family protein [Ruminococcus sp.]|nr:amidoligase family protein [Ruminococcus sp.]
MEEKICCTHCGEIIESNDYDIIYGEPICQDCVDNYTVTCDRCDEIIWDSDAYSDDNICLCGRCYEDYYSRCEECDAIIHNDDTYEYEDCYYCHNCYQDIRRNAAIHEYSYKPEPKFFGKYTCDDNTRFFGVELEIDGAGKDDDYAEEILDIANKDDERIYIKTDGSLDDGMEIVSHPMTLDYHKIFCWENIMKKAVYLGYRSHQTSTCGLHIHVNRDSFGLDRDEQDEVISRILYFVEHYWNEMLKFSRRSEYVMNRWAARYGYENSPKAIMDKAKKNYGRYVAVNLCNYHTIEFRMFKGTLKYNTFIATLELVARICDMAYSMTDEEIAKLSWSEFVLGITEPELIQYLKERSLYINEKITSEEEM